MPFPEFRQKLLVANDARVKFNFNRFHVVADVVVGGGRARPAGIASLYVDDAVNFAELILCLPEAPEGEEDNLDLPVHILIVAKRGWVQLSGWHDILQISHLKPHMEGIQIYG